jgi:LysM repeat protein
MSAEGQSPLRVLAPASLVVFTIVLLIVVATSLSGSDDDDSPRTPVSTRSGKQSQSKSRSERTSGTTQTRQRRFYVVKPGDNLAIIAEQTGVSLERLRELNQTLDPQGLVSGQRVKLPPPGD